MNLSMEKIDRIENHLKVLQEDSRVNSDINRKILSCLVGNEVNGNIGLVHNVKNIDNRVRELENIVHEHTYTILLLKYITGVVFIGLVTVVLKLIFKI